MIEPCFNIQDSRRISTDQQWLCPALLGIGEWFRVFQIRACNDFSRDIQDEEQFGSRILPLVIDEKVANGADVRGQQGLQIRKGGYQSCRESEIGQALLFCCSDQVSTSDQIGANAF